MFLDRDEMKFAILYTLKRYVEPVTMPCLCEILTWDKEVMGYFELAELLEELIEDDYVAKTYYRDEACHCLSEKGKDTNDFFFQRVSQSVRKRIDKKVHAIKFAEQADPNAVKTEILPVAPQQYMASLQMLDAGTPMLELQIYAGTRSDAEKAAKVLKAQAAEIYQDLVRRMNEKEPKKKGDESHE